MGALWKRVYGSSSFNGPDTILGSRTRLVMRIVYSRGPLALASHSREFATTRATLSRSQADPVLFLITKRIREPINFRLQAKKTVCTILTGKKTFCLLPGKELCQVVPESRRFCLSTIEMRERL
jgi:hypothetical protein